MPTNGYMVSVYAWLAFLLVWLVWAVVVWRKNKSTDPWYKWLIYRVPEVMGFYLLTHGRQAAFFGRLYDDKRTAELIGMGITLSGLLFAIWARAYLGKYWSSVVSLKAEHRVVRTGPYRLVRHPIYTGILLGAVGTAIASGTVDAYVGFVVLVIGYVIKLRREERVLIGELGDEYRVFQKEVPALVPFVW